MGQVWDSMPTMAGDCPAWTSFIAAAADSRSPSFHKEYEFLLELTTLAPWPTHFSVLLSKVSGTKPVGFVMVLSQTLCQVFMAAGTTTKEKSDSMPWPSDPRTKSTKAFNTAAFSAEKELQSSKSVTRETALQQVRTDSKSQTTKMTMI